MGIKVSQMPSTNTLTDNDLVMVVQDNENKKINKKDLQNNLTDPDLTKRVEELEEENAYLNSLVEQAFDKKEVEGEELSIDNTIEAKMNVSLYGNTKQNGEPTPVTPVEIQSVTGNNKVVVSNKNLLNIENRTYTNNGISAKVENGTFIINGTPSGSTSFLNFSNITLKAGTYTISANNTLKLTNESDFRITNSNGTTIFARLYLSSENAKLTFTLNEDLVNGNVQLRTDTSITYNNFVIKPQLEQGDTATSYVPHKETIYELDLGNIEMNGIGEYRDTFVSIGDKWYKREVIGSVTLNGSENWQKSVKTGVTRYFQNTTPQSIKYTSRVTTNLLLVCSNYFLGITQNASDNNGIGIAPFNSVGCLLNLSVDTSFDTVEKLKTFIADKKPIYKYVKAESTDIEITDTTLISQLEALKTAMSYTEQTNISQINDDIPFILKVTALASYNSRIVALENAILNANRSTQTENARKSNEIIEETKKEVVDK